MLDLENQLAVVTGSSGAIGGAIARHLTQAGCRVLLLGRSRETLRSLQEELKGEGGVAVAVPGDLTSEEDLAVVVAKVEELGGVDILVHSHGVFAAGAVETSAIGDLDRQYEVNVRSPFRLTQLLLASLRERQGQVVFMNSNAGLAAAATVGGYSASKFALRALADALRAEVNEHNVRVLSVYPGRTASAMQRKVCLHFGQEYEPASLMTPDDVAIPVVNALRLERSVEMTDLHLRPMRPP